MEQVECKLPLLSTWLRSGTDLVINGDMLFATLKAGKSGSREASGAVESRKSKPSLEVSDGSNNDQNTTTARSWVSIDWDSYEWIDKPLGPVRHGLVIFMQGQLTDFHERERWLQRTFEDGYKEHLKLAMRFHGVPVA